MAVKTYRAEMRFEVLEFQNAFATLKEWADEKLSIAKEVGVLPYV